MCPSWFATCRWTPGEKVSRASAARCARHCRRWRCFWLPPPLVAAAAPCRLLTPCLGHSLASRSAEEVRAKFERYGPIRDIYLPKDFCELR